MGNNNLPPHPTMRSNQESEKFMLETALNQERLSIKSMRNELEKVNRGKEEKGE